MPTDDVRRPRVIADAARRRWWIVLGVGGLAALLGIAYGSLGSTTYVARASVLVAPLPGTPFDEQIAGNQLIDLSSEAQLVRSDQVADRARAELIELGHPEPPSRAALIGAVDAIVEVNTQVLRITFASADRTLARDGANAFATAFLGHRQALARQANRTALESLADTEAEFEDRLGELRADLAQADPGSDEATRINGDLRTVNDALTDVIAQRFDLRDRRTIPGQVLSPAALPTDTRGISPAVAGGLGLVGGLVAGAALAALLERLAGRIRRPDALPDEPPALGVVRTARGAAEPVLLSAPDTDTAEAYRLLHLALDAALPSDSRHGQVVVVAPVSGRTPPVAANLALAAAGGGRVTTLIEGVPDQPGRAVPAVLASPGAAGLSDCLLAGDDPIGHRTSGGRGLTVLGPGPNLDRAAEAYVGPRMRTVLDGLRRAADLVLLTAPPLSDPDGQALAAVADQVLLLVTLDVTTRGQLDAALSEARRVHANVIGLVAVDPEPQEPTTVPGPVPPAGPEIVAPEQTAPATWVGT